MIPAGHTIPLALAGNAFYVIQSSGTVYIRPLGGSFVPYGQGQGANVTNQFPSIQIQNANSFEVIILLWVGFGKFVDNQQCPSGQAMATYVSDGTTATFTLPDLSGSTYTSRIGIYAVFADATPGDLAEVVPQFGPPAGGITAWIEAVPAAGISMTGFLPFPSGGPIALVTSTHESTFVACVLYNS